MADDPPSVTPEKDGDHQSTANNPADKKAAEPKKKFQLPKRKTQKNSGLTKLEWGGFFVDIYVTLWIWSDLIACHDIKRLIFLLAAVFVAHGVLCYFLSKLFKSWRWALVAWFAFSITAIWISYNNYQPFPTNSAESKLRTIVVEAVKDANSTEQYAESNNRVLQTKVSELEAKAQWRTITAKQEEDFTNALTSSPKGKVDVICVANDQEALSLAQQIIDLLKISEYKVNVALYTVYGPADTSTGVVIGVKSTNSIPPCAIFLQRAFAGINIKAPIANKPFGPDFDVCIWVYSKN